MVLIKEETGKIWQNCQFCVLVKTPTNRVRTPGVWELNALLLYMFYNLSIGFASWKILLCHYLLPALTTEGQKKTTFIRDLFCFDSLQAEIYGVITNFRF